MSSKPPKLPFLDSLKNQTEALTALLQWMAELIARRNWVSLLMLVDVVLILFCTPGGVVPQVLKSWFTFNLPQWYQNVFWLTFASIFIAALIIAVRNRPGEMETPQGVGGTAIKGLRAFTSEDAGIFKRLQRESDLNRCVESIANGDFRFGILMGLSGCGKTSFLRAGLLPRLKEPGYNLRGVYVRFSDEEPLKTIRKAIAKALEIPLDWKEELADKEDGLISPVDLQILAWMITAQNTSELRAFNGNAFQKFGGVEELLSRYLQEVLLAQTMKTRREAAVKVLLALIDLEQQVRSGVLTLEELAAKNPHVQSQEIKAAVKWLERGDVRLITPVEKDNSMGYELAHERLIGAVMKQANQELTNVSRANHLLVFSSSLLSWW